MLPEPLRLLVSAYAAGDLSPRRKSAAERLLRHSAEARRILKDIRFNRRRLRMLSRPERPCNFADKVVAALPAEKPPIIRPSTVVLSERSPISPASRWAAAAVVTVALGIGAAIFLSLPGERASETRTVAKRPKSAVGPEVVRLPPRDETNDAEPAPEAPAPSEAVLTNAEPPIPAAATNSRPEPLGSVIPPPPRLKAVSRPRLAMIAVRDFESPTVRQSFGKDLARADAHHVDLFCKDSAKALDRLQATLKARGVKLHVDAVAHEAAKRKVRQQFLIYCDDLTAAEWVQTLQALAAADKKAGDGLFDSVVTLPLDTADQRELTTIAGTDLTQRDAKAQPGAAKKDAKVALVAALSPWRTAPNSKEVKQFLDSPAGRPAGAIAVVLTLRLVGA
jgi:hypothetical protein